MPVFGLIDNHIVTGIIDKVSRKPTINEIQGDFTLYLSDIKTRRKASLPSDLNTGPAQLQLMLYHRLLWPLVSPHPDTQLNLGQLWAKLRVNPSKPFSLDFMRRARRLMDCMALTDATPESLNDLANIWKRKIQDIRVSRVDNTLELMYFSQTLLIKHGPPQSSQLLHLGTTLFTLDNERLDEHLSSILNWWHGERPPRGVAVEGLYQCLNCEFLDGCEWREEMTYDI